MKIEVFEGEDGWRWHLKYRGKVMCTSGEAFDKKGNAKRAAQRMQSLFADYVDIIVISA